MSRGDFLMVLGTFVVPFRAVFVIVGLLLSIQRASRSLAKTGFFWCLEVRFYVVFLRFFAKWMDLKPRFPFLAKTGL